MQKSPDVFWGVSVVSPVIQHFIQYSESIVEPVQFGLHVCLLFRGDFQFGHGCSLYVEVFPTFGGWDEAEGLFNRFCIVARNT